jgi:hypothetical protein
MNLYNQEQMKMILSQTEQRRDETRRAKAGAQDVDERSSERERERIYFPYSNRRSLTKIESLHHRYADVGTLNVL